MNENDKPTPNLPYLCFSPDTPEETARRRFLERFGYPPAEIHRHKGLLWLGPITTQTLQAKEER